MGELISIIIPVYNCDLYLRDCVNSVLSQNYENIEIILIDDGSTDKSGLICDEYAAQNERVRAYHQKNAGVSAARNVGLDMATGTYIVFLDADDILADNNLEQILAINPDADLVIGGTIEINEDGQENGNKIILPEKVLNQKEILEALFYEEQYGYLGILTPKVFKAEIIETKNIRFDTQIKYNEDRLFITEYLLYCDKIRFITDYYYYYRQRSNSALGQIKEQFKPAVLTELAAFEKMKLLLEKQYHELYYRISHLIFEKALYWLKKIPKNYPDEIKKAKKYMSENAKICLKIPGKGIAYKVKIVGHCMIGR